MGCVAVMVRVRGKGVSDQEKVVVLPPWPLLLRMHSCYATTAASLPSNPTPLTVPLLPMCATGYAGAAAAAGASWEERLSPAARAQMRREMEQYLHPEFVKRYVQVGRVGFGASAPNSND